MIRAIMKTAVFTALVVMAAPSYSERVNFGVIGGWDTYKLFNLKIPSRPDIHWLCRCETNVRRWN